MNTKPFQTGWLYLWSGVLAVGWLLPNHYLPWPSFHADAWISLWMLVAAGVVISKFPNRYPWHLLPLFIAVSTFIPFGQYAFGVLPFAGQAWMGTAFVLGLLLATLVGARWSADGSCQAMDGLFLAIGAAGILSVGMELYQWLSLSGADIWISDAVNGRMFANFMQPNQLGTFLLWALLACAWGYCRRSVGPAVAVLMGLFLVFGIVLTQSRTAYIGGALLVVAAWVWRKRWPCTQAPWIVTALAIWGGGAVIEIKWLSDQLLLDRTFVDVVGKTLAEQARPAAYRLFLDAITHRPLWGYGWSNLSAAQIEVALDHPRLEQIYLHSHNLFIDLVLWCGIPMGGLMVLALAAWVVHKVLKVQTIEGAILVMFVVVVGWHAMLELPLHYAYMLLPTGLVVGALNMRHEAFVLVWTGRWPVAALCAAALSLLVLISNDYFRAEANIQALRFERAKIGIKPPEAPPDVVLLTHVRESLVLARFMATNGMNETQLEWMRKTAAALPTPANLFEFIAALALNGRTAEAARWVEICQRILPPNDYASMKSAWTYQAQTKPQMAQVVWPQ